MPIKKTGRLRLTLYALVALLLLAAALIVGQRLNAPAKNRPGILTGMFDETKQLLPIWIMTAVIEPPNILSGIFKTTQQSDDRLPDDLTFAEVPSSATRLLAQHDNRTHWVAYNQEGEVCLISMIGTFPQDFVAGMGCSPVDHFRKYGVFVSVTKSNEVSTAVLFPDGYQKSVRKAVHAEFSAADVFNNLIVLDEETDIDLPDATLRVTPDADEAGKPLELLIPKPGL
jgi:hypothetical protein